MRIGLRGRAETVLVFDSVHCFMHFLAVSYEFHATATQLPQTEQESKSLPIITIICCAKE